ncbi:hypothetical protein V1519DRAFT_494864 [Lipomyces tetrasporus]
MPLKCFEISEMPLAAYSGSLGLHSGNQRFLELHVAIPGQQYRGRNCEGREYWYAAATISGICVGFRPQSFYTRGRTLSGRVVYVGDGDNLRLYHTPGGIFAGWDWLRRVPLFETGTPPLRAKSTDRRVQPQQLQQPRLRQRKLADETIHVRSYGIDAPECKSYGRPGQAFGPESRDWLRAYLLGRKVRIRLYSIDQYQRAVAKATVRSWTGPKDVSSEMLRAGWAVAKATVRSWTGPKDVSSEMLRAGWAVVYESKFQAAFGSSKETYQREEQYALDHKNGMWKYGKTLIESVIYYESASYDELFFCRR